MEPQQVFNRPGIAKVARWGVVFWTLIGGLILGAYLWTYVLGPIKVLFPILIVSTILVYLLNPLVTRLERRGLRRGFGAAIIYFAFLVVVGIALAFLIPIVVEQVKQFALSVPDLAERAAAGLHRVLDRLGLDVSFTELLKEVQTGQSLTNGFLERATWFAGGLLEIGLILVVGPILGFYLLVDFPKMKDGIRAAIPPRKQDEWKPVFNKIATAIGGFFRGQLVVAAFVGLASMFVLWIVGLPFWALVGIIAGVFNIVPMIGPFIGGAIAVLIALTATQPSTSHLLDLQPVPMALGAVLGLLIVQQLDNHIISPNVVARSVKLHPVTVMLSLFIFGIFFGFWGLLLAVPTVATVKILLLHYWDTRVTWPPEESVLADVVEGGAPASRSGDDEEPQKRARVIERLRSKGSRKKGT